jgi:8-oxo-dGTP diphosphatase
VPSPDQQDRQTLRAVQRTAAYAVVTDAVGGVLLVRASNRSDLRGRWFLPGGGLRHGEHPRAGVLRELAEETGLRASVATPRDATADVIDLPHRAMSVHTLRLIYDVQLPDPARANALRPEPDGTSDLARFVSRDEAAELELMPFVAELLGLPAPTPLQPSPPDRPEPLGVIGDPAGETDPDGPVLVQRPAAYAVLVDETGPGDQRMLLTRLSGSGETWTLPGGGIDHGEHPLIALEREVYEEAGLPYTAGPLIDIGSRHFTGRAPNGRLEDFHALRLIYAGSVPFDQPPQVIEVGGSTDLAAWVPVPELGRIRTAPTVREALQTLTEYRARQSEAQRSSLPRTTGTSTG